MYKSQCWSADVINGTCVHRGNTIRNHFFQKKIVSCFFSSRFVYFDLVASAGVKR